MLIAQIIPLARLPKDIFYFDYLIPDELRKDLKIGQIVQIPLRNKKVQGVVYKIIEKHDLEYSVKPITKILFFESILGQKQQDFFIWFSNFYYISQASLYRSFIPAIPYRKIEKKLLRTNIKPSISVNQQTVKFIQESFRKIIKNKNNYLYYFLNWNERLALYLQLAKNSLINKEQLLILVPTIKQAKQLHDIFQSLLNADIAIIYDQANKNQTLKDYLDIASNKTQIIIGTRSAVFLNYSCLKTIIIDQEQAYEYKQADLNPRYQLHACLEKMSQIYNCQLIYSSCAPKIETYFQVKTKKIELIENSAEKIDNQLITLVNLKDQFQAKDYTYLSSKLIDGIESQLLNKKNILLYFNRRGISRYLICQDCGLTYVCPNCQLPLAIHSQDNKMLCHHCQKDFPAENICPKCKGINLKSIGSGVQKIELTLRKIFSKENIVRLDSDNLEQDKDLASMKSTIFLATDVIFSSFREIFNNNLGLTALLAADQFPSIAEFRLIEKNWQNQTNIITSSITSKVNQIMIQALNPESLYINSLINHNYSSFFIDQIRDRQTLNYPPYSRFIKLIYSDKNQDNCSTMSLEITKQLTGLLDKIDKKWQISVLGSIQPHLNFVRGKYKEYVIINLTNEDLDFEMIPEILNNFLKSLPAGWQIDIDPLSLS